MTDSTHAALSGSSRSALPDAEVVGPVPPGETVEFTIVLRRRAELPDELVHGPDTVTTDELAQRYGAHPTDAALVTTTLLNAGVHVLEQHPGSRRIRCSATAQVVQNVFGIELSRSRAPHPISGEEIEFRSRTGELHLPPTLDGVVVAVLGLDNRPQARPLLRASTEAETVVSYTPPQLATIYGFPGDADGTGQIAAIIELGGAVNTSDVTTYFQELGLPTPTVTSVGVDGTTITSDPQIDREVMLDVEVIGAIAPKAQQTVYFGPNTDQGFIDTVSQAIHATPRPTVISISWGSSEDSWTAQARTALDDVFADGAALGVSICIASGDHGSTDGVADNQSHANFPASSPHALAVGGTTLHADPTTGALHSEVVWNDGNGNAGGGGVSDVFPLPQWQQNAGVPTRSGGATGRGVPDVAADADPATGYSVRVDGQTAVIGGTSAAAPLWAGLLCRYAQLLNTSFGLVNTALYKGATKGEAAPGLRGITSGNNGAYQAGPGWNACTGLGVPTGDLRSVLSSR